MTMDAVLEIKVRMPLSQFMRLGAVELLDEDGTVTLTADQFMDLYEAARREVERRVGGECKVMTFQWHVEGSKDCCYPDR